MYAIVIHTISVNKGTKGFINTEKLGSLNASMSYESVKLSQHVQKIGV